MQCSYTVAAIFGGGVQEYVPPEKKKGKTGMFYTTELLTTGLKNVFLIPLKKKDRK